MKQLDELEGLVEKLCRPFQHLRDPKYHKNLGYKHQVGNVRINKDLVVWMNKYCQGNYSVEYNHVVSFENPQDAMLVKLTWSGQ